MDFICSQLSKNRVEEEFFPYLKYITEEMDNEDDFLSELSQQLKDFFETNPKIDKLKALPLIESILLSEDPIVIKNAINVVVLIARENKTQVVDLLKTLIDLNLLPSKTSALKILQELNKKDWFHPDQNELHIIDNFLINLLDDDSLHIQRLCLRQMVFYFQHRDKRKYMDMKLLQNDILEKISLYFL